MASSIGLYVSATVVQKGLALVRLFVFLYLLSGAQQEYGLWGLGSMIIALASPLMTLGSNHGLARYVSRHELAGRLGAFAGAVAWRTTLLAAAVAGAALLAAEPISRAILASQADVGGVSPELELQICRWSLANALLLAIFTNMLGFIAGLRAYRLAAALEILFNVAFLVVGPLALMAQRSAAALLAAHLGVLGATVLVGGVLLRLALRRIGSVRPPAQAPALVVEGASEESPAVPPGLEGGPRVSWARSPWGQVLVFGLVAMVGMLCWRATGYVSFYLANRRLGAAQAGVFGAYSLLAQPVAYLASAAWAVVLAHLARRWEGGQRGRSVELLQTSYNALSLGLMTLSVALYATAQWWVRLLPGAYRGGLDMVGGLMLFSQATAQLALATMVGQLHERPWASVLVALAGAAANLALAVWWIPTWGLAGGALAAGVGLYAGGGAAAMAYLLIAGPRLKPATYGLMLLPVLLLLPPPAAVAAWCAVLALAAFTRLVFDARERAALACYLRRGRPA